MELDGSLVPILLIGVVAIIVLSVFFSFFPLMLWISALASGVRIGIITLVAAPAARNPEPDCESAH